jgi:membrane protease YdiL (CAAX protease family)
MKMKKETNKRIICYLMLSFIPMLVLSCLYYFVRKDVIILAMMLLPAIASVITRIITKEGFERMMIHPYFKGNLKWYFISYFAPPFIACFGAIVYFITFSGDFSPLQSAFAIEESISSKSEFLKELFTLVPIAIIVNPIMGIVQCFGEELGWRGYLLPKLGEKLSPLSSSMVTGVIWGLWHAPIIAIGYNYGTDHRIAGIFAMIIFCTALGIILGFLTYKVHSIWPAVLFHASINGMDLWAPSTLFMSNKPNVFLGPDILGVFGGLGFIIIDIVIIMVIRKWKKDEVLC